MSRCGCGCDETPGPGKTYVLGHNARRSPVAYFVDENGCWIWQRSKWRSGYGRMKVAGRWTQAYRVYYERAKGSIPQGLTLDHLCGNRACVNPDHLEPCTLQENQRRAGLIKLTDYDRALIAATDGPYAPIAEHFGVSASTISRIKTHSRLTMEVEDAR